MSAFTRLASTGEMTILLVEQRLESALDFAESVHPRAWADRLVRHAARASGQPEVVERLLGMGGFTETTTFCRAKIRLGICQTAFPVVCNAGVLRLGYR